MPTCHHTLISVCCFEDILSIQHPNHNYDPTLTLIRPVHAAVQPLLHVLLLSANILYGTNLAHELQQRGFPSVGFYREGVDLSACRVVVCSLESLHHRRSFASLHMPMSSPSLSRYVEALIELRIKSHWLHFFFSLHVHDAIRVTHGIRQLTGGLRLMRTARNDWPCETNASVAHLLPPPVEPLYAASRRLCPMRGAIRCHFHSLKCALLRDSPLPHVPPQDTDATVRRVGHPVPMNPAATFSDT